MTPRAESLETLLEQAEAFMDDGDHRRAAMCYRRAQALAPFRQDIRGLLAEAIGARLESRPGALDAAFGAGDFAATREPASAPRGRRRPSAMRWGFGLILSVLVAALIGAVALAVGLRNISQSEAWEEAPGDERGAVASLDDAATVDELLEEADEALAAEHFADALALLDTAMDLEPDDTAPIIALYAEVHLGRGRKQFTAGRYDRALADCEQATVYDPEQAEAFYSIGWCHYYLGVDARNSGNVDSAQHHLEAARDAFGRSIEIDDSLAKSHRSLGQALIQLGDREHAFEAWRRTIAVAPDSRDADRARRFLQSHGMSLPEG